MLSQLSEASQKGHWSKTLYLRLVVKNNTLFRQSLQGETIGASYKAKQAFLSLREDAALEMR